MKAIRAAIDPERACAFADAVAGARESWISDFEATQFSLGRAWYTDLEQDRTEAYFKGTSASDALVERVCPGLQSGMLAFASRLLGVPVKQRTGWCGPGVHIFPAGGLVATRGGEIHFDVEGLTASHLEEHRPAMTLVLMLRPPASGGGLRVWEVESDGGEEWEDEDLEMPNETFVYRAGDLLAIDAYRLHQIQPFSGDVDRISATCHLALTAGEWEAWF